ncbi:MAG: hypothetical protein GKR77_02510 [Legionellales bacterium]|nr:hypothetical protein [Legionellales bacterium]
MSVARVVSREPQKLSLTEINEMIVGQHWDQAADLIAQASENEVDQLLEGTIGDPRQPLLGYVAQGKLSGVLLSLLCERASVSVRNNALLACDQQKKTGLQQAIVHQLAPMLRDLFKKLPSEIFMDGLKQADDGSTIMHIVSESYQKGGSLPASNKFGVCVQYFPAQWLNDHITDQVVQTGETYLHRAFRYQRHPDRLEADYLTLIQKLSTNALIAGLQIPEVETKVTPLHVAMKHATPEMAYTLINKLCRTHRAQRKQISKLLYGLFSQETKDGESVFQWAVQYQGFHVLRLLTTAMMPEDVKALLVNKAFAKVAACQSTSVYRMMMRYLDSKAVAQCVTNEASLVYWVALHFDSSNVKTLIEQLGDESLRQSVSSDPGKVNLCLHKIALSHPRLLPDILCRSWPNDFKLQTSQLKQMVFISEHYLTSEIKENPLKLIEKLLRRHYLGEQSWSQKIRGKIGQLLNGKYGRKNVQVVNDYLENYVPSFKLKSGWNASQNKSPKEILTETFEFFQQKNPSINLQGTLATILKFAATMFACLPEFNEVFNPKLDLTVDEVPDAKLIC